jgi:hypothetical protein
LIGQLALVTAAAFVGAAFYITFAEQPARLSLDDRALLAEWKLSYQRGFAMQASLALISTLLGLLTFWWTRNLLWFAGAIVIFSNWPYTLLVMLPVNKRHAATPKEKADGDVRRLVEAWGRMHTLRGALGFVAVLLYVWALTS